MTPRRRHSATRRQLHFGQLLMFFGLLVAVILFTIFTIDYNLKRVAAPASADIFHTMSQTFQQTNLPTLNNSPLSPLNQAPSNYAH